MSAYKVLAQIIASNKLKEVRMPTSNLDTKKLTMEDVRTIVEEEFKDAKAVKDVKAKEEPWNDVEPPAKEDWVKKYKLKEWFNIK
jgi:lipoate-protein ligase A